MLGLVRLSSLPAALLQLLVVASLPATVAAQDAAAQDLAPRLLPEHEALQRRHAAIEERLAVQAPIGMRKMSGDPTEKFFPEYWIFEGVDHEAEERALREHIEKLSTSDRTRQQGCRDSRLDPAGNGTLSNVYRPPLQLHSTEAFDPAAIHPRNLFSKRGYLCPTGYNDCSNIGYVNTCCAQGETCQKIANEGIGVVGCCATGNTCSGSVSSCDTAAGQTSCTNEQNPNGCCARDFVCDPIGCVPASASTVTTTASVDAVVGVTTETVYATAVITPSGPSTVYITKTTPTSTVTLSSTLSTATTVITTTITGTIAGAPVRATSANSLSTTVTDTSYSMCPTGYLPCSAYYLGGCCQSGMDCHSTNCPSPTSVIAADGAVTVIVNEGSGVTTISVGASTTSSASTTTVVGGGGGVVSVAAVTVGSPAPAGPQGNCPTGFFGCAADAGGGCCPNGYACATTCSATVAGLPKSAVKAPGSGAVANARGLGSGLLGLAGVVGLGMALL